MIEIERKFLLRSDAWRDEVTSRVLMRQGYLTAGSRCSIRARIAGELAWLNLKAKRSGMTQLEYEYPIPRQDAGEILDQLCKGRSSTSTVTRSRSVPMCGRSMSSSATTQV